VDSNFLTGGAYGITIYGATNAAANRGIRVVNNKMENINWYF
jgi:hypothetical protein